MKTTKGNSPKPTRYDSRALFLAFAFSICCSPTSCIGVQFGITLMAGGVMLRWPLAHPDTPGGRLLWLQRLQRLQRCTGVHGFLLTL